ncbi:helix-turn-helix transcriptional regulator [Clostridium sp. D2Q-11]|uniref:Helix-turn-helix transcriptional regulator n=1 Tax=Anaeromonas frigoriresistens TaxID=2683708 RepID=A0A942UYE8_9FIRM|nr:helix-turn-helix transcriptional regulator [Anaeromonas frigoriresistens]MBS4539104.1 helix-turn-helix transcriptional regulator [Anaeromonas frigoriresistens]
METIRILSPGERIKNLRKQLGIKQEELAGSKFSKNYISMFENNKRNINPINATYLADRINYISKEKEVDIYITASYLLKTESDMATEECNLIFEEVELNYNLTTTDKLHKIFTAIQIAKEYGLSNYYGRGLYLLGKLSLSNKIYHCAVTQFLDALDHFSRLNQISSVIETHKMLGITMLLKDDIDNAIIHLNLAESNVLELEKSKINNDIREEIAYYRALCYFNNNDIIRAQSILNKVDTHNEKIMVLKNKVKENLVS